MYYEHPLVDTELRRTVCLSTTSLPATANPKRSMSSRPTAQRTRERLFRTNIKHRQNSNHMYGLSFETTATPFSKRLSLRPRRRRTQTKRLVQDLFENGCIVMVIQIVRSPLVKSRRDGPATKKSSYSPRS